MFDTYIGCWDLLGGGVRYGQVELCTSGDTGGVRGLVAVTLCYDLHATRVKKS